MTEASLYDNEMDMTIYFYIKNTSLDEYAMLPDIKYLQCFPASINILHSSILRTFHRIKYQVYKVTQLCLGQNSFNNVHATQDSESNSNFKKQAS